MLRVEVVQDVAEPSVHLFQDGDVLVGWPASELAQARYRVIHPRVTGGWCFSHDPFGITVLIFVWVFVSHVLYPPAGTLPSDADKSEARMATVEECREALQTLIGRLGEMNEKDRSSFFSNRSMSCHVTDLGVTFMATFTDQGAEPVKEVGPDEPPADIRLTANSDDVVLLAATPANIARMWMAGRVKIQASIRDLLALRRLL
jgi:predicted lipid carrier protein YhbT